MAHAAVRPAATQAAFEKYRGSILDGVRAAFDGPESWDRHGHQRHVRSKDIARRA